LGTGSVIAGMLAMLTGAPLFEGCIVEEVSDFKGDFIGQWFDFLQNIPLLFTGMAGMLLGEKNKFNRF